MIVRLLNTAAFIVISAIAAFILLLIGFWIADMIGILIERLESRKGGRT